MAAKKLPTERHRGERGENVVELVATSRRVPPPESWWPADVVADWQTFWSGPLADERVLTPADLPALRRLHDLRARMVDAWKRFDAEPEVAGSMGQTRVSPWADVAMRLAGEIRALEDRYGITPKARVALGASLAAATKAAQAPTQAQNRPRVRVTDGTARG